MGWYRSPGGCSSTFAPAARLVGQMNAILCACDDVDSGRTNLISTQLLEEDMSEFNIHALVLVRLADEVGQPWIGFSVCFIEAAATVLQ